MAAEKSNLPSQLPQWQPHKFFRAVPWSKPSVSCLVYLLRGAKGKEQKAGKLPAAGTGTWCTHGTGIIQMRKEGLGNGSKWHAKLEKNYFNKQMQIYTGEHLIRMIHKILENKIFGLKREKILCFKWSKKKWSQLGFYDVLEAFRLNLPSKRVIFWLMGTGKCSPLPSHTHKLAH